MSGSPVALVLAAGAGSRFGGVKVLADLEGRPLLQHVLDALAASDLCGVVVVLGASADEVERAIAWRDEVRVVDPHPEAGLSSSLRAGLGVLEAVHPGASSILVALGDQPTIQPSVIRALVVAMAESPVDRPVVVPRYDQDGALNPALVRRDAWHLVAEAHGDRGLGPILAAHPELVLEVPVPGGNPDVDTRADLGALSG